MGNRIVLAETADDGSSVRFVVTDIYFLVAVENSANTLVHLFRNRLEAQMFFQDCLDQLEELE